MNEAGRQPVAAGVDDLGDFDAVIDVRSPAEFALDHIPGALSMPVLDDDERARVGTLYTQVSPFEARKVGAALVARNIARHLEDSLLGMPRPWRPLVYCWRGGQRSGAMATILSQVGWPARRLDGGYRAFRRRVLEDLEALPPQLTWVVLHGPTGSGKTALLAALARQGAQVLDLEALARHRGSVLGGEELLGRGARPVGVSAPCAAEPGAAAGALDDALQPGQKAFETALWQALRRFSIHQPVFVEAESRRIGRLSIPGALFECLGTGRRVRVEVPLEERVAFLVRDYAPALQQPAVLVAQLARLAPLHGHERIEAWRLLIEHADWPALARELVVVHYDPAYRRGVEAVLRRAVGRASAQEPVAAAPDVVQIPCLDEPTLDAAARAVLAGPCGTPP
jgi:tRNA 2-selenouridine synthase